MALKRPIRLGISSGASLGVACVVLLSGAMGGVALSRLGYMGDVALSVAAIIGALAVMALIVYVSPKVKGNVTLLIIGVMLGYVASAAPDMPISHTKIRIGSSTTLMTCLLYTSRCV